MAGAGTEFYTVKEVAQILGVSYNTAYQYACTKLKRGNVPMPVQRFGRHMIRIPKKKFQTWAGLA